MASIMTVHHGDNTVRFESNADSTLLENLEQHGVVMEYQCREGYCGSCQVKLVAGEVQYIIEPLAFVAEDSILSCCCRASQSITIEIPDHNHTKN